MTSAISPSYAVTLAKATGSLSFTSFSHAPDNVSSSRSAFAYVLTEQGLAVAMTEPQFVTGTPLLLHPLTTQFPVISQPLPGGEAAIAPLAFDQVTGLVAGSASLAVSDSQPEAVVAVNLNSESQLSGRNSHLVSTIGQSGFRSSFLIGAQETFSVNWQSFLDLAASTSIPHSETIAVQERHVIYFSAKPAAIEFDNAVLRFSLYPHTRLSASDPRIDVGGLEVFGSSTSPGNRSLYVTGNNNSLEVADYFQLEERQDERNFGGSLSYFAEEPTILTVAGYTSSSAYTSARAEEPRSVPEPSSLFSFLLAIGVGRLLCNREPR